MSKVEEFELQEQLLPTDVESRASPSISGVDTTEISFPYTLTHQGHEIQIDSLNWRESLLLRTQIILCFAIFTVMGLADQTVGTLLPFLVEHYNTTETTVSVVFMLQFFGYSIAALCNDTLHVRFGRRGALVCSTGCLFIPFTIISLTESLPLFIFVYLGYGLGIGVLDSCCNVFLSSVEDNNEIMGLLHGFYGVGSVIAPPFVSLVLKHSGYRTYYFFLSILSGTGMILVYFVFKNENKWKYDYITTKDKSETEEEIGFISLLKDSLIICFCGYLFFYIGAELSIGSWLLTYLRKIKGMEQLQASYIVSWFWIGLTCGRMLLGFVTKRFKNEYRANLWYSFLSWTASLIFMIFSLAYNGDHYDWISKPLVFVMGVFVGPLFPTAAITLLDLLPVHLQVIGSGIANSLGGTGSAVLPFLVGALSRFIGFQYLLVFIDFLILIYCAFWFYLPRAAKRTNYDF
uniref:MFS transporter n=1 Tax=Cyberlindnera americana TaxID=36016 RepID=A0A5P8N8H4_9ASCO|nr:MFS transporter [Cyberlindnera americana]